MTIHPLEFLVKTRLPRLHVRRPRQHDTSLHLVTVMLLRLRNIRYGPTVFLLGSLYLALLVAEMEDIIYVPLMRC